MLWIHPLLQDRLQFKKHYWGVVSRMPRAGPKHIWVCRVKSTVSGVGGFLGKLLHTLGPGAALCRPRSCIDSFFHFNTCSLGNGPSLPKSSQMAWILYPCQSTVEFNNNHEVKLGPFLSANPQNHLAFPFLWKTVECMCWGEWGGWGWKKRNRPIICFLKDNPLFFRADRSPRRS